MVQDKMRSREFENTVVCGKVTMAHLLKLSDII